jgi:hypothetical protein
MRRNKQRQVGDVTRMVGFPQRVRVWRDASVAQQLWCTEQGSIAHHDKCSDAHRPFDAAFGTTAVVVLW